MIFRWIKPDLTKLIGQSVRPVMENKDGALSLHPAGVDPLCRLTGIQANRKTLLFHFILLIIAESLSCWAIYTWKADAACVVFQRGRRGQSFSWLCGENIADKM